METVFKMKITRIIYLKEYISGQRIPSFSNITYHSRKLSPTKDWEKLRPEKYLGEDYWAGRIGMEGNISTSRWYQDTNYLSKYKYITYQFSCISTRHQTHVLK